MTVTPDPATWQSCRVCEGLGYEEHPFGGRGDDCAACSGDGGAYAEAPLVVEISASQIGAWDLCQRKWAYTYVAGIRSPSNASAALGSAVHEKLERHMLKGEAFDTTPREDGAVTVDAIAAQAAPYVPRQWLAIEAPFRLAVTPRGSIIGSGDEVEAVEEAKRYAAGTTSWHDGSDLDVVILNGRIDVIRDAFTVMDWKTSKDIRRYAKTPEDLETDPAAIIYAAALETATKRRSYEGTSLVWVYLSTRLKGAKSVSTAIQGVRRLPMLAPQLEGIVAARRAWKSPEDAPPNPAGCMAYGGCFFRDRCSINQNPQGPSVALGRRLSMTAPVMDLAALLRALPQQGAPTPAAPTPAAPTPAPQAAAPTVDLAAIGIDLSKLGGAANAGITISVAADRPSEAQQGAPKPPLEIPPAQAPKLSTGGEGATAGYVLYVDCYPINRECLPGHEVVRQAAAALAVAGVADWRAASYQEGRGALAVQVKAILDAHNASPVPRKAIIVDTSSEAERACLDLFLAGAANVVRGVGR
jgi:hypothetical protein